MRYFFYSKIEVKEDGGYIHIPFNIWEVCKQREIIKADVVLDNKIVSCELLPIERGNYILHIHPEDLEGISVENVHRVLLHVRGSLIKMNHRSPYSLEHPIRMIRSIELIKQPNEGCCAQAVVGMLAGKTIPEVMDIMDCREWQGTLGRMISALNYYGIDHSDIVYYTNGEPTELPPCCIMMEKMGRFSHYFLYYKGKFYDPTWGILETYDISKLHGYLEIFC